MTQRANNVPMAIVGNLFAHNGSRNPTFFYGACAAYVNNVIYHYGGHGIKLMEEELGK